MTTVTRREKTTTVVEYVVPARWPMGVTWNEVQLALAQARQAYREATGGTADPPSDDSIWVRPGDDEIVVYFEKPPAETSTPAPQPEPEFFSDGTVVISASGDYWLRYDAGDGHPGWQTFGDSHIYGDDIPKRPLRIAP